MPAIEPRPERILAVLLGAGWYAQAPKLAHGTSFENSARDLREYLTQPDGMGLPRANISWLFDDTRSAVDQLRDVGDWLERRQQELNVAGTPAADLILYYVGHGMFCGPQRAYHLAIRATEESREGLTSISVSQLAQTLNDRARFLRKFLVLDCCFAGAAYHEFLSGPLQASRTQLVNELPSRGTAMLCAASAKAAAIAPRGLPRTMFSDSLLKSLEGGHPELATRMSLSDVGALVRLKLKESFPDSWVRPEIHSPHQEEGEIAAIGLFPNPSAVQQADPEEDARRRAEEEKKKTEENLRSQEAAARLARERLHQAAQERKAAAIRKAEEDRKAELARIQLEAREAEQNRRAEEQARAAELLRQEQQAKREAQARFDSAERRRADEAARKVQEQQAAEKKRRADEEAARRTAGESALETTRWGARQWAVAGAAILVAIVAAKLFTGPHQVPSPGGQPRFEQPRVSTDKGALVALRKWPSRASTTNQGPRDCDVCPEMVDIPAGQFTMGSPDEEKGRDNSEGPQHPVRLQAFSIGKYDVTFGEWDACEADGGCRKHPSDQGWGRGRQPVINVSWDDAQEYVRWISRKTLRHYRLPSESQWEYAARARTTKAYYWGGTIGRGNANCDGCGSGRDKRTSPVGSFAANPWGLFDMAGNVWQWTEDCYNEDYKNAPGDGSAWEAGDCGRRVVRGGSWLNTPQGLRSAIRDGNEAYFSILDQGFRVARTSD